jgi:hypothetical protein
MEIPNMEKFQYSSEDTPRASIRNSSQTLIYKNILNVFEISPFYTILLDALTFVYLKAQ